MTRDRDNLLRGQGLIKQGIAGFAQRWKAYAWTCASVMALPAICELMDLYASASMYPAISEADILCLPIPAFSDGLSNAVTQSVQSAFAARALLASAKRAVEIAIEEGEAAALAFLQG